MAADRIVVNKSKQNGINFVRLADLVAEMRALSAKLNLNVAHDFNAADYSVMEADFGLVAGAGANAATLLGLINTIFNTNTDVLGVNRAAQLDEFVGRVSGQ